MAMDTVKVVKIIAVTLSIGATLLNGWAGNKTLETLVDKAVEKRLKN